MIIKVGNISYDIVFTEHIQHEEDDDPEIPGFYGKCHGDRQRITIATSYSVQRQETTLLHEALHAIANEMGLEDLDEQVIDILAGHLAANWKNLLIARENILRRNTHQRDHHNDRRPTELCESGQEAGGV